MEDYLLDEEAIITRSQNDEIILTTHRIRQQYGQGKHLMSMMLDQITCIKLKRDTNPALLFLGIVCLAVAAVMLSESLFAGAATACIVGIFFILFYLRTRSSIISVYSSPQVMRFHIHGMDKEKALLFINNVEDARKKFLRS